MLGRLTKKLLPWASHCDMYPLYWTTSKEGIFICGILMSISSDV